MGKNEKELLPQGPLLGINLQISLAFLLKQKPPKGKDCPLGGIASAS